MHPLSSKSTHRFLGRFRLTIQKIYGWYLEHSFVRYQPLFRGMSLKEGVRPTMDRWTLIEREIKKESTVLDLGCAEGFFTLTAARDLQCVSLGLEADDRRLAFAQHQLISQNIQGAGFMRVECTTEFITKLPQFDYVIFLSIFHHLTARHGLAYAKDFLNEVRLHTKKAMFFETGLSSENTRTTNTIPSMGKDHTFWLSELLLSTGWSRVEVLGESLSYARDAHRPIFKVYP